MPRRRSPRPETPAADLDGARVVLQGLTKARADEARARAHRDDYIEAEHKRGVRAVDIAEALTTSANDLGLDEAARRNSGTSEGSVHHALARRGAKKAR